MIACPLTEEDRDRVQSLTGLARSQVFKMAKFNGYIADNIDDAIQQASLQLCRVVRKREWDSQAQWASFARECIKNELMDWSLESRLVHIPKNALRNKETEAAAQAATRAMGHVGFREGTHEDFDSVENKEFLEYVRHVIACSLTTEQAQLLHERYFRDMPLTDMATSRGVTEGAVKGKVHRALAELRKHLRLVALTD